MSGDPLNAALRRKRSVTAQPMPPARPDTPLKLPNAAATDTLPGRGSYCRPAVAKASAVPARASVRLLLIWFCKDATDWLRDATLLERFVIVDGLKLEA